MDWRNEPDARLRQAMVDTARGDVQAFRAVVEALEPRLMRYFARFGVPEGTGEDLLQESCLRLFRAARRFDPRRPFMPWALTVARRVTLNWLRDRKPTVGLDEADRAAVRPAADAAQDEGDLWRFARAHLTERAWELLWLHYGEELTAAEIGAATGRTPLHVRVLLHRARTALARAIDEHGPEPWKRGTA